MSDEIDQLVGAVDDALREAVKKLAGARKQLDDMVGIRSEERLLLEFFLELCFCRVLSGLWV